MGIMMIKKNLPNYTEKQDVFSNLPTAQINILEVGFLRDYTKWNFRPICEYFWHLYCNPFSENCGVRFDGQDFPLTENRILLIPPYTIYSVYSSSPIQHFYIHFLPEGNVFSICRRPWYVPSDLPMIRQIGETLANKQDNGQMTCLVTGTVQRALGLLPIEAFQNSASDAADQQIGSAIKFYLNNTEKKVKNEEVAQKLGMSLQNFELQFKRQTGMAPREFHRHRQMQIAADMLTLTSYSIEYIAQKIGYADRFIFSRIFKKYYGISPASYRKLHQ